MKRKPNSFKQNLELKDEDRIKREIAKSITEGIGNFPKIISQELPKKIVEQMQKEEEKE